MEGRGLVLLYPVLVLADEVNRRDGTGRAVADRQATSSPDTRPVSAVVVAVQVRRRRSRSDAFGGGLGSPRRFDRTRAAD
jgi:hypothetical protein